MKRRNRWLFAGTTAILAGCLLAPIDCIVWDGGFLSIECRVNFRDPDGRPVEGVALRVETQAGGNCYLYPVSDYAPDSVPTSGQDGILVFHHVSEGMEFGGKVCHSVFGIPIRDTGGAPEYVCHFSWRGRDVYSSRFSDIYHERDRRPQASVLRHFVWPDWPLHEYIREARRGGEWDGASLRMRLFDGNGDGTLDREERIAMRVATQNIERRETFLPAIKSVEEDVDFGLVELTIIIPPSDTVSRCTSQ